MTDVDNNGENREEMNKARHESDESGSRADGNLDDSCLDENCESCCDDEELSEVEGGKAGTSGASSTSSTSSASSSNGAGVDFKERYYYLAAEMENLMKRHQKEKDGLLKYGNEKLLNDLIEVIDNFDRTLQALAKEEDSKIKNIANGIDMVSKQLSGVLKKYGLGQVESVGKMFDPNFHEAVSQVLMDGKEDQEIVGEFQKGYVLNGRLLRPAKVVVCKDE